MYEYKENWHWKMVIWSKHCCKWTLIIHELSSSCPISLKVSSLSAFLLWRFQTLFWYFCRTPLVWDLACVAGRRRGESGNSNTFKLCKLALRSIKTSPLCQKCNQLYCGSTVYIIHWWLLLVFYQTLLRMRKLRSILLFSTTLQCSMNFYIYVSQNLQHISISNISNGCMLKSPLNPAVIK